MATIDAYLDELLAGDPAAAPTPDAVSSNDGTVAPAPGGEGPVDAVEPFDTPVEAAADESFDEPTSPDVPAAAPDVPSTVESRAAPLTAEPDAPATVADADPTSPAPEPVTRAESMPAPAESARERATPSTPQAPVSSPSLAGFMAPAAPLPPKVAMPATRTRTATGGNRWLRVCVGADSYAFELLRVQEVVRVAPVVAMRGAGHAVLGVMNLRGRIVPVFDLGLWLDVGAVHEDERSRVVVIERNDELIGVLVTAVEDVVSLEREHVEPPLLGTDPGPTLGVARVSEAPTVLLDADALFG